MINLYNNKNNNLIVNKYILFIFIYFYIINISINLSFYIMM